MFLVRDIMYCKKKALIAKTTTAKGLTVTCRLDRRKYATGRKVTNDEMTRVNLHPATFPGELNYVIKPHRSHTNNRS